ncbi:MAG: nucleotidyltransferase family protein [Pseudomonadota bacterium]
MVSPELALLAACCRWPPSSERQAAVQAAASSTIDWSLFERVVAKHRVAALVRDGLRRAAVPVPTEIEGRLRASAAAAARTALAMAQETIRLQRSFDDAEIPVAFVKGAPLAALAYGDLGLKQSWDIDLLTTPEAALAARRLLETLGYILITPAGLNDSSFAILVSFGKECSVHNADLNITIDLHWRLIANPSILPNLNALSATRAIEMAGASVRTLDDVALLAYLSVHGAQHGWFRLKWLADVNAILANTDASDLTPLYRSAVALGAGRTAAVAILLCHRLLGLQLPPMLLTELRADIITSWIEDVAMLHITCGHGAGTCRQYSLSDVSLTASHFFLIPGIGHFLSEARLKWMSPDDRMRVALPGSVHFLYHLIRLPRWAWRFATIQLRRLTA